MADKDMWRVTGGPVGFTSPAMAPKWRIEKTTKDHGPHAGRTFPTYDDARRHVAARIDTSNR